jgi:hypothetical protein
MRWLRKLVLCYLTNTIPQHMNLIADFFHLILRCFLVFHNVKFGSLPLDIFSNCFLKTVRLSKHLLFAYYKNVWRKTFPRYSFLPQSDTHFTRGWCTGDFIKINVNETNVTLLYRQIDFLYAEYELCAVVNALTLLNFLERLLIPSFFPQSCYHLLYRAMKSSSVIPGETFSVFLRK